MAVSPDPSVSYLIKLNAAVDGAVAGLPVLPEPVPTAAEKIARAEIYSKYQIILSSAPETKPRFTEKELSSLYNSVVANKVASLDALSRYDPTGVIGFCFGRAMTAHLLARAAGAPDGSIRKLFMVGDMRSGADPEWRFHVTTLVKGPQDAWFAVDPVFEKPQPVLDWIKRVRSIWDKSKKAKLYFVDPSAVLPDLRIVPAPNEEKQEHLIEVSFDPATKDGFTAKPEFGPLAYSLSSRAEAEYFSQVSTSAGTEFDFLGITINGKTIPYNNYFADLMNDILPRIPAPAAFDYAHAAAPSDFAIRAASGPRFKADAINLYSPKLDAFIGKTQ
jgi:hypothetical protein